MSFFDTLGVIQYPIWIVLILMVVQIVRATIDVVRAAATPASLRIHSILVLGALAACLGVLGSLIGVWLVADLLSQVNEASPSLVWSGIQVTMGSSVVGFVILGVASIAWLALQYAAARRRDPGAIS